MSQPPAVTLLTYSFGRGESGQALPDFRYARRIHDLRVTATKPGAATVKPRNALSPLPVGTSALANATVKPGVRAVTLRIVTPDLGSVTQDAGSVTHALRVATGAL